MTTLEEAWGRPSNPAGSSGSGQPPGTGRLVGQNFYSGQNRNTDPNMMPYVGNGMSTSPGTQMMHAPDRSDMMMQQQQPPPQWQMPAAPPSISVQVEKSDEEKELFRYLRSRLGEMDWDRAQTYFEKKCERRVKRAGGECGCLGVSDHVQQCGNCKNTYQQRSEFRANLTLYLLVGVFVLLALNFIFPKGLSGFLRGTKPT